jgi:hypothetical protein
MWIEERGSANRSTFNLMVSAKIGERIGSTLAFPPGERAGVRAGVFTTDIRDCLSSV